MFKDFKIPKIAKFLASGSVPRSEETSEIEQRTKFEELKMAQLFAYDIPPNIWQAEQYNNKNALNDLRKLTEKAREDEKSYFTAATALLHLEEAANSEEARSFDFLASNKDIKIVSQHASKINISILVSPNWENFLYIPEKLLYLD